MMMSDVHHTELHSNGKWTCHFIITDNIKKIPNLITVIKDKQYCISLD